MAKDLFSGHAEDYSQYRPQYPSDLFSWINTLDITQKRVWDVGTGNGQLAFSLSSIFDEVYATDISEQQILQAPEKKNIHYSVQAAECTNFPDRFFDMIIVGQAIHWFDFEQFYKEVRRVTKSEAYIIAVGYGNVIVPEKIKNLMYDFYHRVIFSYWDAERRYIDEEYQTIPFPFEETETPKFEISYQWSLDQLLGYIHTWSAVKHFIDKNGINPMEELKNQMLELVDKNEWIGIKFPLLLRVGRVNL